MADFRSIIGKTLSHYRIDKLLGHGGMAAVYQATDLDQERLVALKIMHTHLAAQKSFEDRFLQEASAISRLSHPNIVRVYGFDRSHGELFIVMELVTGGTLRSYVKRLSEEARYMPLLEVVDVGRQLASALHYAHNQGMMHRDVKPDNVVLRSVPVSVSPTSYQPVLTDFGLARLVDDNEHTDQPLGTYPYMSPEQCLGERIDTRTDIYSLGIVLYELTAGRLPFVPRTLPEATRMHTQEQIVKPSAYRPDAPPELDTIILKALAKDPAQRYQTGEALAEDLERVMRLLASQPVDDPDRDMATDAFTTEKLPQPLSENRPAFTPPVRERRDEGKDRLVAYSNQHPAIVIILKRGVNGIGTADDQVLKLQGPYVSRRHARIEVQPDDTFRVTDVGSTNGTWVGSIQLAAGRSMKMIADDTLRIGDYWIWIDRDSVSAEDIPTDAGADNGPVVVPLPVPIPIPLAQDIDKTPPPPEPAAPVVPVAQAVDIDKTPPPPPDSAVRAFPVPPTDIDKTPPPPVTQEPATVVGPALVPPPPAEDEEPPVSVHDAKTTPEPLPPLAKLAEPQKPVPTSSPAEQTLVPPPPSEPPPPARVDSGPTAPVMPAVVPPQPPAKPRVAPEDEQTLKPGQSAADQTVKPGGLSREEAIAARRARMKAQREAGVDFTIQDAPGLPPAAKPSGVVEDFPTLQGMPVVPPPANPSTPSTPPPTSRPGAGVPPPRSPSDSGVKPFGRGTGGMRTAGTTGRPGAAGTPAATSGPSGTGSGSSPSAPRARRPADDGGVDKTMMDEYDAPVGAMEAVPAPVVSTSAAPKSGVSLPNLVGQKLGAYRISRLIGHGSQSSVYEAWDTKNSRPIGLKVLHPNLAAEDPLRRRFLDEARVLMSLEHPNIVKVYNFDTADNAVFMVMELIQGGSIRSLMQSKQRTVERSVPLLDVMQIARQMADALHYAHQQGLVHRDIRPDNIVLRDSVGEAEKKNKVLNPVLTDFALAKAAEQAQRDSDIQGLALQYLSPEEANGQRTDTRSDIYELGTLMYEMITGQTPYQPQSMAEAMRMYGRESFTRPSDLRMELPPDLERVVMRALEREPANRYQTAAEMSRALQTVITSFKPGTIAMEEVAPPSEEDLLDTVVMESPLSEAMPMYTPQPVTDEQVGFERLIIMSNNHPLRVIPMNKNLITIGRSDDQTVKLEGKSVSRRHARIERGFGSQFRIIDVGSINGTYVGSQKLTTSVAEILSPDKVVRLGEYWLKLEPAAMKRTERPRSAPSVGIPGPSVGGAVQPRFTPITNLDDGEVGVIEAVQQYEVVRTTVKKIELPAPEHDKVGFKVINPIVTVAPGSSMTMTMEIHNLSSLVDHFVIQLEGLPLSWYTIQQAPIYLMPNNRETASITFHPPLDSKSSEGGHYFEVRVVTRAQGIKSVAIQCLLNILPFKNFVTSLEPRRATRRVRPELMIRNTGNTFGIYTVSARDREQAIIFELPGKQFSIPPGQEEYMTIRLKERERPFIGVQRSIPFEIIVTADDERLPPQTLAGDMAVNPRFPIWIIGLLIPLLLICLLLALFGYTQYQAAVAANMTATPAQQTLVAPITQTAIAESDPDIDGLSNIREKELNTDQNSADTDGDGVNDGDEVRVWNTNPTNRDTDGDGITDGEEINVRGTNPNNEDSDGDVVPDGKEVEQGTDPDTIDTDGDSIPDGEDTEPLVVFEPTLTPFPTLPGGTPGQQCEGSPPQRMGVGMPGRVEPGGVANFVRDNPGVNQGAQIGQMPPETLFVVTGGPQCDPDEQLRWWLVESANGLTGWTAEGRGDEYYIGPREDGASGGGGGGAAASGGSGGSGGVGANVEVVATNPEVKALSDDIIASLGDPNPSAFDRARMGIQLYQDNNPSAWNSALDQVGQLRMGWIKVQVNWSTLQPDGPGSLGGVIGIFEQDLAAARGRGLRILLSVAKAPTWARGGNSDGSGPPDDPQALADFLTLLLARVGSNVDAIEIWNEPNLRSEWNLASLPFGGAGYMDLFMPAYRAIRAFSPNITIITAGLAPTHTSERSIDHRAYLRQMYAAGLGSLTDIVVGVHPYGWGNSALARCCDPVDGRGWDDNTHFFFLQTLEEYRTIQLENNHSVQLWATEFGWPTWENMPGDPPEAWMGYNSAADQATNILRAFQLGQRLPYLGPMFLWNLNFGTQVAVAGRSPFAAYSLRFESGTMRPAFGALVPTS